MADSVIDRLAKAINSHDLEALVGCFAPDYEVVWPVHPSRSATTSDHVRGIWEMMFAARPDIAAAVTARVTAGDEVWAEWEFTGTERDGSRFHQRGVIIAVVADDVITRTRFYMEPVEPPVAE